MNYMKNSLVLDMGTHFTCFLKIERKEKEKVRQACDAGKHSCGVFLDLRKAFDTVRHSNFLNKCFNSFLKGRH